MVSILGLLLTSISRYFSIILLDTTISYFSYTKTNPWKRKDFVSQRFFWLALDLDLHHFGLCHQMIQKISAHQTRIWQNWAPRWNDRNCTDCIDCPGCGWPCGWRAKKVEGDGRRELVRNRESNPSLLRLPRPELIKPCPCLLRTNQVKIATVLIFFKEIWFRSMMRVKITRKIANLKIPENRVL